MRRWVQLLAIGLMTLAFIPTLTINAATCTWTGGTAGNWHVSTNWSCNKIPDASDAVTISTFGTTITLTMPAQMASLAIMQGNVTINGDALDVTGLTSIQPTSNVTLNTNGSRLPTVTIASPSGANITINDLDLTTDSLQTVTIAPPIGNNGSATLNIGNHAIGTLNLTGGLLWTDRLTVTNALNWTTGGLIGMNATATLIVAESATAHLSNGTLAGATLINETNLTITGSTFPFLTSSGRRAQLINNGTLTLATPSTVMINGSGDLRNNGIIQKTGGDRLQFGLGLPMFNYGLIEVISGTLQVTDDFNQNAGELRLAGGNFRRGNNQFASFTLNGGAITGSGTITSSINNLGGTIAPTGILNIVGAYTHGANATLAFKIGGHTPVQDFDTINITPNSGIGGNATIQSGTININAINGFKPVAGDQFQVVMCSTNCSGSFATSSGTLAPAFGGFVGNSNINISEPQFAMLASLMPDKPTATRTEINGYTMRLFNPTNQVKTINNIQITLPLSFTYQLGSTTGSITSNPFETVNNTTGTRQLSWFTSLAIPANGKVEFHFSVVPIATIEPARYRADLQFTLGAITFQHRAIASVTIPLNTSSEIVIGGGNISINITTNPPSLMIPRTSLIRGITVTARITCPFVSCGNLTTVYIEHGRRLIVMTPISPTLNQRSHTSDYGFWQGYISPPSIFPGEPMRIFPDWDDHRPCVYYDYGGGGGRPQGCVDGGDNLPTPQLYDPSGFVTDSVTGDPIVGATVTLYRMPNAMPDKPNETRDCRTIDTRGGSVWTGTAPDTGIQEDHTLLPKQIEPQVNPQITNDQGRYGWNVVTGCWYIKVSAPGYMSKISALVGVPPEVTDLDIELAPSNTPMQLVYIPLVQR